MMTHHRVWFKRQIEDGFQIHHLNGNRKDNTPDNLVMIEGNDHMRLHLIKMRIVSMDASRKGGINRMAKLTPERRKQIAVKAANKRWKVWGKSKRKPRAA
jgi:hypothetical protein